VKGAVIVGVMTTERQMTAAAAVPATNRGVLEFRINRLVAGNPRLIPLVICDRISPRVPRSHVTAVILKFHSG
jgi:hypothetical protein